MGETAVACTVARAVAVACMFTRCDRRGDRLRDQSPRSLARPIAATIERMFTRCDRRAIGRATDRRDRSRVCLHSAIVAAIGRRDDRLPRVNTV